MFASRSLVGIRLVYKKSVRAVLVARPAFRGLRIARLVGRTNNAEASRRLLYMLNRWRSRVNKSDMQIHIGIYCLSLFLTNLRKLRSF